jgi:hypothetical protein
MEGGNFNNKLSTTAVEKIKWPQESQYLGNMDYSSGLERLEQRAATEEINFDIYDTDLNQYLKFGIASIDSSSEDSTTSDQSEKKENSPSENNSGDSLTGISTEDSENKYTQIIGGEAVRIEEKGFLFGSSPEVYTRSFEIFDYEGKKTKFVMGVSKDIIYYSEDLGGNNFEGVWKEADYDRKVKYWTFIYGASKESLFANNPTSIVLSDTFRVLSVNNKNYKFVRETDGSIFYSNDVKLEGLKGTWQKADAVLERAYRDSFRK